MALAHLRPAHQKEIDVVAGKAFIKRCGQPLAGSGRLDQMRSDDDDQIGLVLQVAVAAEQRAKNRHRADPRNLRAVAQVIGLQQAGYRETLTVAQLDGWF